MNSAYVRLESSIVVAIILSQFKPEITSCTNFNSNCQKKDTNSHKNT